jgi:guanylate kinase
MKKPLLIVVSAPSGAGKSTLCDRLLAADSSIVYSVSCTTRPPRGQEADGVAYCFLSPESFETRVGEGAFLEHATVHGNRYGTLKETVRAAMASGKSVMMDIDVQGACQVREALATLREDDAMVQGFVDVFIEPPSMAVLRTRLEGRGEDAADVIEQRLKNAAQEMACADAYRFTVVNDDLAIALREIHDILEGEAMR